MRDSSGGKKAGVMMAKERTGGRGEQAYHGKTYFESYYRATVKDETPNDLKTIGPITEMESKFHYNAVENSIIRAVCKRSPPPAPSMIEAWRALQARRNLRLLDLGSGAGHWIDFMRETFYVSQAVGIEITQEMSDFLQRKYSNEDVLILDSDITDSRSLSIEAIGGAVDYITAIGIMFHIVDDVLWEQAISNLAAVLRPGGLAFIGGDFGAVTKNVEFAKTEKFDNWKDYAKLDTDGPARVTKRLRSLADWQAVATKYGLTIVDVVRTEDDRLLTTPENDVLVLHRGDLIPKIRTMNSMRFPDNLSQWRSQDEEETIQRRADH